MEETPEYTQLNEDELKQIESEFGHPLSIDLALWFIRNRANREAVERMLHADSPQRLNPDAIEQAHRVSNSPPHPSAVRAHRRKTVEIRPARKHHHLHRKKCA